MNIDVKFRERFIEHTLHLNLNKVHELSTVQYSALQSWFLC